MPPQINLLIKEPKTPSVRVSSHTLPLFGGSILLFIIIIVAAIGTSVYAYSLQNQSKTLADDITTLEGKITSLKDVEEKKSMITLKSDELKKIYDKRFDYVKAIDDVQKLFSYTLTIDKIQLDENKKAEVSAVKTGTILISESQALGTDISELILSLTLPSSEQLQETVDNLKSFLGKGLTSADVIDSHKLEENKGYEVNFRLTFGSDAQKESGVPVTPQP